MQAIFQNQRRFKGILNKDMYERQRLKLLLLPSVLSGVAVTSASFAMLVYGGWMYISENLLFYDQLFGAYGLKTFFWQISGDTPIWRQAFFNSPATYYILTAGVAVMSGLVVYMLLESGHALLRRTSEVRHAPRELWLRLILRIVSLAGWVVYLSFFVSIIAPSAILLTEDGIDRLQMGLAGSLWQFTGALGLAIASLHMHVIFMRLCCLRPRVFGDSDIEAAESSTEHG